MPRPRTRSPRRRDPDVAPHPDSPPPGSVPLTVILHSRAPTAWALRLIAHRLGFEWDLQDIVDSASYIRRPTREIDSDGESLFADVPTVLADDINADLRKVAYAVPNGLYVWVANARGAALQTLLHHPALYVGISTQRGTAALWADDAAWAAVQELKAESLV